MLLLLVESNHVWLFGDRNLGIAVARMQSYPERYPELSKFDALHARIHEAALMEQVPWDIISLIRAFKVIPKCVIVQVGGDQLGVLSVAQLRAHLQDMLTDVFGALAKACPYQHGFIGVFVSLIPPRLHYVGFEQQRVGRRQRCKINASLAKAAGQQGALPVAHSLLVASEEQYENPRHDPMLLSSVGVDILLADFEQALRMPPFSHR